MLVIEILAASGDIMSVEVSEEVTDALQHLPENTENYFIHTPTSQTLSVDALLASHVRMEGVINANRLMALAARNMTEKRHPLKVKRFGSKFLVLDGNSTFVNAKFSGWKFVLCNVIS